MELYKIAVLTGTRADYGLLKPLLQHLQASSCVELQLIVTGMHLSSEFGNTIEEIHQDDFPIAKEIEILLASDSSIGISKAVGLGFISFAEAICELKPDIAVVLGDRFEALAFAQSAVFNKIPVAHIHGGEATYGAIDEPIRHAITKFASLHFASTEVYRKRIIQMGEDPDTTWNVGALGVENTKNVKLLDSSEMESRLGFTIDKNKPFFLVTYHPVTLSATTSSDQLQELLNALALYGEADILFTYANADNGGRIINQMINEFVQLHENTYSFASLGQLLYLSCLNCCDLVIGNSSSGIIEAPSFSVPTINIGDRQEGRVRAKSIIDVKCEKEDMVSAINSVLSGTFLGSREPVINPYEKLNTSRLISERLIEHIDITVYKKFHDIDF